ncbi:hypothetical protein [Streptomyces rapamycinicus]|uniref:hypothetical protein n=1 Tax=Streptomyces rapamycinicus TaxID=1226757 RepID=UPI0020C9A712|nr:hypothetical protein [Streptomyces rapamycinicus]UTP37642.1 hypothetical protein LIV37_50370 [Streptomyces rapamycinicus NRRL 5491]
MSRQSIPADTLGARPAGPSPVGLRVAAEEHGHARLVFHGAASVAEVTVAELHRRAGSVAADLRRWASAGVTWSPCTCRTGSRRPSPMRRFSCEAPF